MNKKDEKLHATFHNIQGFIFFVNLMRIYMFISLYMDDVMYYYVLQSRDYNTYSYHCVSKNIIFYFVILFHNISNLEIMCKPRGGTKQYYSAPLQKNIG